MPDLEAAIHAGSHLYYWSTDASPDAWVEVDETFEIQDLGAERPEIARTPIDRTSVARMAGLNDGNVVTINLNRTTENSQLVRAWYAASQVDFKLSSSPTLGETDYFSLVPTRMNLGTIKADDPAEMIFAGRITGAITQTDTHA